MCSDNNSVLFQKFFYFNMFIEIDEIYRIKKN